MREQETAFLVMTDLHYGKKTATFDPDIFKQRLDRLGERLAHLKSFLGTYQIDKLKIAMLGDVNDGTDIYASQPHHQAVSNVEKQAHDLTSLLAPWFENQLDVWKSIEVECVPGNHGRASKFAHEASNWDIVAYRYLQLKLEQQKQVTINFNETGDPFIRKVSCRGHNYLLYHGHNIKSFGNIPWYGQQLRISRWLNSKLAPFDAVLMGHNHSFGSWQINRCTIMQSGTLVSDDEWALQSFGYESANKWWLFGSGNSRPITWQFGVDLD
jgi:DNA polymerase II small subunit/DNA polymerase delta subunit B